MASWLRLRSAWLHSTAGFMPCVVIGTLPGTTICHGLWYPLIWLSEFWTLRHAWCTSTAGLILNNL